MRRSAGVGGSEGNAPVRKRTAPQTTGSDHPPRAPGADCRADCRADCCADCDSYSPGASWVLVQRWDDDSSRGLANIAAIYEANGEIFVVLKLYHECKRGDELIAGATSFSGLQLTVSADQLRVEPEIQLLALQEVGFTPLHRVCAADGSATFTLLL